MAGCRWRSRGAAITRGCTDRAKDNCQFVCGVDLDGRTVDTLDGQQFLAVNGVQTLSAATAFAGHDLDRRWPMPA